MAVPDFQSIMLPLMQYAADEKEHTARETIAYLATEFKLTEDERGELLPSGSQAIFDNRVGWAKTHLSKAGLLKSIRRSVFIITERGKKVLLKKPDIINIVLLKQFPEYIEFIKSNKKKDNPKKVGKLEELFTENTPEEVLEYAYQVIKNSLADEVMDKIKSSPFKFFPFFNK